MELSQRGRGVLQRLVELYIDTAAPVSSQALAARLARTSPQRGVHGCTADVRSHSSASLRATMAELTLMGLLAQPHTSAGRVPTEAGLRVYVDALLQTRLRPWDRSRLDAAGTDVSPAHYVARMTQQLVRLTGQVAMVAVPSFLGARVRELGLVRLSGGQVLAYFVGPSGHVQQKLVQLPRALTADALQAVQNLLNELVRGRTLQQVRRLLARQLHGAQGDGDALLAQAAALGQALWPEADWEVVVEGTAELLVQPEFADRQRLRALLVAIEHKALMLALVEEMLAQPGVRVRLGSEHALPALTPLAYVGCSSSDQGGARAAVGLLGPARMDYGRLMPLVQYAAERLGAFVARL